ncbi:class I SAM-dependent methyltransferase [Pseudomonas eucalypticola]|uniref:Class I SAM-dependent methyltransferase n=1 Tax=Pseudomonas eucalypticola TaxID=2599595 RepID=A0A7D5DA76_9PSED|nr:methyltransferase domain-containing protein [Pseudomonas eucalypticola]QKZ06456.1 class I SAM-dependent methyltransferase [Pseudomonas eucalypticola]
MKRLTLAVLALACAAPAFALTLAAAAPPSNISEQTFNSVLKGPWRDAANSARDRYRHPRQTLQFFGLRQDQTVIEITPGTGWYSEVLAPLLKDHGQYIAAVQSSGSADTLKQKFAATPAQYGKASLLTFDPKQPKFGPDDSADAVLTFRNVHNWVMADNAKAMFQGFYQVLKPGGTLGVVDHRGKPGETVEQIKSSGYLPTDYVIKLATDAGFTLAGQSEVNANAKDTKDYPEGVWTLPPTYKLGDKDKAKYQAIGESERMTLRFIKPVAVAKE